MRPLVAERSNPRELRNHKPSAEYTEAMHYEHRTDSGTLKTAFRASLTQAEALALLSVSRAPLKPVKVTKAPVSPARSSSHQPRGSPYAEGARAKAWAVPNPKAKAALLSTGERVRPRHAEMTSQDDGSQRRRAHQPEDSPELEPNFEDRSEPEDSDEDGEALPEAAFPRDARSPTMTSAEQALSALEPQAVSDDDSDDSAYDAVAGADSDVDSDDSQSREPARSPSLSPTPSPQKKKRKSSASESADSVANKKLVAQAKQVLAKAKAKKQQKARAKAKAKAKQATPVNPNTKVKPSVVSPTRPYPQPQVFSSPSAVGQQLPKPSPVKKAASKSRKGDGTSFPAVFDADVPPEYRRPRPKSTKHPHAKGSRPRHHVSGSVSGSQIRHEGGKGSGKSGQFTVNDMDTREKAVYAHMCKEIRVRLICAGRPWASAGDLVAEVNDLLARALRELHVEIEWHAGFQALLYQNAKSWISKCGAQIKPKVMEKYSLKCDVVDSGRGVLRFGRESREKAAAVLDSCEVLRADGQADSQDDDTMLLGSLLHECAVCLLGPMLALPALVLDGDGRKHCEEIGFGLLGIAYAAILRTLEHAKQGSGAWEFNDDYQLEANNLALAGRDLPEALGDVILNKLWTAAGAHSAGLGKMAMVAASAEAAKASLFRKRN
ncbi:hypothetical protein P7C70_g2057, partial [Phenoliferia sp. Uapishka_3]